MAAGPRVEGLECLRCHALYPETQEPLVLVGGCPRCAAEGIRVNETHGLELA